MVYYCAIQIYPHVVCFPLIDELRACLCVCMNVCYNVDQMIKNNSNFVDGSISHKLWYGHTLFGMTRVALVT